MSKRKLSKKRLERRLIVDSIDVVRPEKIGKVLAGTQAVFSCLLGIQQPLGKVEIAKRVSKSKAGKKAWETYKTSGFYKEGDTIEKYSARRSGKLISWGLGRTKNYPHSLPIVEEEEGGAYFLTSFGEDFAEGNVD